MVIRDYSSALAFLLDRLNYERTSQIPYRSGEFRLDRMRELMRAIGDPQLRVPVVHVAGTKGKGSTATMIAAILQQAGYQTGLYTSPHLERVEERFAIDGVVCPENEFVALTHGLAAVVREFDSAGDETGKRGPTFFEITTAMGFLHFAQRPVDIAVLEVGLGGRLDCTNVCQPVAAVITSISFDHTRQLGNTLRAIAAEKAGIIKSAVPVISSVTAAEPAEPIRDAARLANAKLWERGRDFNAVTLPPADALLAGPRINYSDNLDSAPWRLEEVAVNLLGAHQADNATTAIAAIRCLALQGWKIPESAIRAGLASVRCPARVEIVRRNPTVVIDTAHNVASIEALALTLRGTAARRRVLVFACSKDKDAAGMLRLLLPEFQEVVLTRYVNNPRARSPDQLVPMAEELATGLALQPRLHMATDPEGAWRLALDLAGDDTLVCITGSFFLAAELRSIALRST